MVLPKKIRKTGLPNCVFLRWSGHVCSKNLVVNELQSLHVRVFFSEFLLYHFFSFGAAVVTKTRNLRS